MGAVLLGVFCMIGWANSRPIMIKMQVKPEVEITLPVRYNEESFALNSQPPNNCKRSNQTVLLPFVSVTAFIRKRPQCGVLVQHCIRIISM